MNKGREDRIEAEAADIDREIASHDNRCQYCGHPSDDGHHYVVLVRGDWYWGCGDGPHDGIDMSIRIGHRVPEGEIRCP